ncbi:MAG: AAA family ATPase [Gammaproteobacteria bacterium]
MDSVLDTGSEIILGKRRELRLAIACLLAGGHLLIEDLPGVGKTTLAHLLARLLGLEFQRIQFTSDLLPADIVGVSIFDRDSSAFRFHRGPIFSQVLLTDEINRATPRAQSALLEAMEERQVTIEGETYQLPDPFFVIATQNPSDQIGTFALPESQLDRFLMRISIGYPSRNAELELLNGEDRRLMLSRIEAQLDMEDLRRLQRQANCVHVAGPLMEYIQDLLTFSRRAPNFANGLSPRAGLALVRATKAWALMEGRGHALPEDVQEILPTVVAHRLDRADIENTEFECADQLINAVPIP